MAVGVFFPPALAIGLVEWGLGCVGWLPSFGQGKNFTLGELTETAVAFYISVHLLAFGSENISGRHRVSLSFAFTADGSCPHPPILSSELGCRTCGGSSHVKPDKHTSRRVESRCTPGFFNFVVHSCDRRGVCRSYVVHFSVICAHTITSVWLGNK